MADITNPLSNLSYTSKDFQTIYPELLDLVKKLTYKWDPSISNESDPGVILLKLNAIIADKNDYNIDKNILETFPLSVTQEVNARQLFDQLGYNMHWYRGAVTPITFTWVDETADKTYRIPRFTMVCDDEGNHVYTIIEKIDIDCNNKVSKTVSAIQGIAVQYDLNGKTIINTADLDENNRLYFNEKLIAENGIFINNILSVANPVADEVDWKRVDNLAIQPYYDDNNQPNKVFKFGVSSVNNDCYIEFPDNVDELFGDGIVIYYLKTEGLSGNVIRGAITNYYEETTIYNSADSEDSIQLTTDFIDVFNNYSTVSGADPESIDAAYRNYLKTVGTFDTLVTLRDYINYIVSSDLCSNGFVCDRTNDIQNCYFVVYDDGEKKSSKLIITEDENNKPSLDPFTLKLYLLEYSGNVYDETSYNNTYDLITDTSAIEAVISEQKCIQHDFKALEEGITNPCLFKNKYTITCTIVPQSSLTNLQQAEIKNNIYKALFVNFNSQKLRFGQSIEYSSLLETIEQADDRIKTVVLETPVVKTYYLYIDGDEVKEQLVSLEESEYSSATLSDTQKMIFAKSVLAGITPLLIEDVDGYHYQIDQTCATSTTADDSIIVASDGNPIDPINHIVEIEPEVTITIPFTNVGTRWQSVYTLDTNESIILTTPSLKDTEVYGNYVKYECNFSAPAAKDYQLRSGEKIYFYWKQSDSDTVYTYKGYEQGTIIKPSFNLTAIDILPQDLPIYSDNNSVPDTYTDLIANNTYAVLTSTKQIAIREENKTEIDRTEEGKVIPTYCYWITHTKTVDSQNRDIYELSFKYDAETESFKPYTLTGDELFIYTNDKQNLVILGSGTRLTITPQTPAPTSTITWSVLAVNQDIDNIYTDGLQTDAWFDFPAAGNASKLTINEMTITAITGPDCQFRVVSKAPITGSRPEPLVLTNTLTPISDNDTDGYALQYRIKASNAYGPWTELPLNNIAGNGWEIRSQLALNISPDDVQQLSYKKIKQTDTGSQTPISPPQSRKQTVTVKTDADVTYIIKPVTPSDPSSTSNTHNEVYLTSNVYISTADKITNINILSSDLSASDTSVNIYAYRRNALNVTIDDKNTNYRKISGEITAGNPSTSIALNACRVPAGTYLIAVKNNSAATLSIKVSGNALPDIAGETSFDNSKVYYIPISSSPTSRIFTFEFTLDTAATEDTAVSATVYQLFKYSRSTILTTAQYNAILAVMQSLDINNDFDYTYIPDETKQIINPLSANSFFNPNHIFNRATISQIDTGNINLRLTDNLSY